MPLIALKTAMPPNSMNSTIAITANSSDARQKFCLFGLVPDENAQTSIMIRPTSGIASTIRVMIHSPSEMTGALVFSMFPSGYVVGPDSGAGRGDSGTGRGRRITAGECARSPRGARQPVEPSLLGLGVGRRSNEAGSRRHKAAEQAPLYGSARSVGPRVA